MKKILALSLAAIVAAASLAGCGCSKGGNVTSDNKEQVDVSKVDGKTLVSAASEEDSHAVFGDVEITIGEAKVIDYNGQNIAIVEFEFRNNGDAPMPFTGAVKAEAFQDDHTLTGMVIDNVDGVDMLSLSENVEKGHQISVQKAFALRDTDNTLEVQLTQLVNGSQTSEAITKYYDFQ